MENLLPPAPNLRPPGQDAWYNPGRDINSLLPRVVRRILERWDATHPYSWLAGEYGDFSDDDVCRAAEAFAAFFSTDIVLETDTIEEALSESGMDDLPVFLRMLMCAMVGEYVLAAYWFGQREYTSKDGTGYPAKDAEMMAELAAAIHRHYGRSPFWRRVYGVKRWVVKLLARLMERLK